MQPTNVSFHQNLWQGWPRTTGASSTDTPAQRTTDSPDDAEHHPETTATLPDHGYPPRVACNIGAAAAGCRVRSLAEPTPAPPPNAEAPTDSIPDVAQEHRECHVDAPDLIKLGWFERGVPVIAGLFPNDYEGDSDVHFPSADFLHLLYTREQMPKLVLQRPPRTYLGADAFRQWLAHAATQPPMPQVWVRIPALIASGCWLDAALRQGFWNGGNLADANSLYIELPEPTLTGEEDEDVSSHGIIRATITSRLDARYARSWSRCIGPQNR